MCFGIKLNLQLSKFRFYCIKQIYKKVMHTIIIQKKKENKNKKEARNIKEGKERNGVSQYVVIDK